MSATDYDTRGARHIDGSRIFISAEDKRREDEVAAYVGKIRECKVPRFSELSVVDRYAERDGRLVGIVEIKWRDHAAGKYPTVWLNVPKWGALVAWSTALRVPAMFVVRFEDCVRWCRVVEIDAREHRITGTSRRGGGGSDFEPIIDVPIDLMVPIPARGA